MFVNNLMVATEAYHRPLLQFEQPASLCAKLPRSQAKQVGGNVYVRASLPGAAGVSPLILWSPTAKESCVTRLASLDEFRKLAPAFEADGRQLDRTARGSSRARTSAVTNCWRRFRERRRRSPRMCASFWAGARRMLGRRARTRSGTDGGPLTPGAGNLRAPEGEQPCQSFRGRGEFWQARWRRGGPVCR